MIYSPLHKREGGRTINIYDVAKMAGVSTATVSRVVNGSSKVSDKTKARVLQVMEDIGYTPNIFARGLGLNSMRTIGIICPYIEDNYMARAVSFLEKNLNTHGYDCILGCSGERQENKEKYTDLLLSKRIDALILVGSTYAGTGKHSQEVDYIRAAAGKVPVIIINGYVQGENVFCICADDFGVAYEATSALLKSDRKKVLFLCDSNSYSGNQKRAGYEKALGDAGYPVRGELVFYSKHSIHETKELLLLHKNLSFDGVLATDDYLAVAALKYAKVKGLRVPDELSVVGFNNSELAVCCEPELTSVDNKTEELCTLAVENLLSLLEKGEQPTQKILVPCEIVKRSSTYFY